MSPLVIWYAITYYRYDKDLPIILFMNVEVFLLLEWITTFLPLHKIVYKKRNENGGELTMSNIIKTPTPIGGFGELLLNLAGTVLPTVINKAIESSNTSNSNNHTTESSNMPAYHPTQQSVIVEKSKPIEQKITININFFVDNGDGYEKVG